MNKVRKTKINLVTAVLVAVGCMTHVSIKYNRAAERLEQQTARTESLKNAYIRYLEHKAGLTQLNEEGKVPVGCRTSFDEFNSQGFIYISLIIKTLEFK